MKLSKKYLTFNLLEFNLEHIKEITKLFIY